ncbi:uncharacterized protein LOC117172847 [Belonocnema kinseyi]|uniref:uncharacterized protein LOC117172847 n=1 Tax=Belonocnema kinseyi TaxID=2817044 RepID=UPI00143D5F55|nr:uncharacterized protein LOC117172847 [Belonocnema kinseyi]
MEKVVAMTVSPPLPAKNQTRDMNKARQPVSIQSASTPSSLLSEKAKATVFIGGSAPVVDSTPSRSKVPEVQSANGRWQKTIENTNHHQEQQATHVVKIRINPSDKNGKVISTVRLNLDNNPVTEIQDGYKDSEKNGDGHSGKNRYGNPGKQNGIVVVCATKDLMKDYASVDSCVRINVNCKDGINEKGSLHNQKDDMVQRGVNEGLNSTLDNGSTSFYYGSFRSSLAMVMTSGQCSPSDTLDSGTCSDLDGTPPPLPKKNSSTIILGGDHRASSAAPCCTHNRTGSLANIGAEAESDDNSSLVLLGSEPAAHHEAAKAPCYKHIHNRTGSLTSSGAEVESDDNESNISCDSLNGREVDDIRVNGNSTDVDLANYYSKDTQSERRASKPKKLEILVKDNSYLRTNYLAPLSNSFTRVSTISPISGTSALSKASTTSRDQSPNLGESSTVPSSPMVKEYTYEERKQEQERFEKKYADTNYYANYNRMLGAKYVYDDDRFYKFHLNERFCDEKKTSELKVNGEGEGESDNKENDEYFTGYKIPEREAIRSTKGTVRGVKNSVRAGIATFLQKPSTKVC